MSRLSRINTIWRKELRDTLRDKRTVAAMVLLPMVVYPVLMLGSLMAFEVQANRIKQETFVIGVTTAEARDWLKRAIDTDVGRRTEAGVPAEDLQATADAAAKAKQQTDPPHKLPDADAPPHESARETAARADLFDAPPEYEVVIVEDLRKALDARQIEVGLTLEGALPSVSNSAATRITLINDQTDIRGNFAATGLQGILARLSMRITEQRLKRAGLTREFIRPVQLEEQNTAPPEKMGASVIAQIVPLILIVMTIMGGIYPAIDLTAGERERGTLETLMVAPVPAVDLITGKFIVVALIGMLSAALNLVSIAGTIYLSGAGDALTRGSQLTIPLHVLPWVFVILLPLAVLFSAALLAVCSFARSFKEAQNYVMPVIMAALIPAVVGILPGTRMEGPLVIMPVTNIVLLTRDLFLGTVHYIDILWVTASTSIYAAAAVAIAARLFGQEAVQFNDNSAIRTLFMRRFFRPADWPNASHAFLLLAVVYSLNFFWQHALQRSGMFPGVQIFYGVAAIMLILFVSLPLATALYLKLRVPSTFSLEPPPARGILAALFLGLSTWVLGRAWMTWQQSVFPMPPELLQEFEKLEAQLASAGAWELLLLLAIVPAVCEEWFFRGFALSGLRRAFGPLGAVLCVAVAFAIYHQSVFRFVITLGLGLLLGLLVVRFRSLFPAMLLHALHNGLMIAGSRTDLLGGWLKSVGFDPASDDYPPLPWVIGAAILAATGLLLALLPLRARPEGARRLPGASAPGDCFDHVSGKPLLR